jgi:predicted HAD superfamily Cof-like phosphohydrolase
MAQDSEFWDRLEQETIDARKITATTVTARYFDPVRDIEDFHKKFGLEYTGKPRALPQELRRFRTQFLWEEWKEYRDASMSLEVLLVADPRSSEIAAMLEDQLDALVDLVYIALGNAYMHGFNFKEAWRRVHEKNMQKVRAERAEQSKRGTTFDVVKPAGWTPPSHRDLVEDHAHPVRDVKEKSHDSLFDTFPAERTEGTGRTD